MTTKTASVIGLTLNIFFIIGSVTMVNMLIEDKANINAVNNEKNTPLIIAANKGWLIQSFYQIQMQK